MAEIYASNPQTDDVFLTQLSIQKVRHLEKIHIPISTDERKHLILTGKNGSGKTSVLEALKHGIKQNEWSFTAPNALGLEVGVNRLIKHEMRAKFLGAFYSAKRNTNMDIPTGIKKVEIDKSVIYDYNMGKHFHQHIVNLKAEKSFAKDDGDQGTVKSIDAWFEEFEGFLRQIFDAPTLRLEFNRKNFNFQLIQEGREPFDFNTLAHGYSAIIQIVTDLILKMEATKQGQSHDVQGIVLIDEIEAHLHIDLQKKILPFLTTFFPRIQFIVTTHSPFVLNSIENAVIYDLENKLLVSDLSGYAYDGIVESYFDNDKYSAVAKEKLEVFRTLVNKEKRTEEEQEEMMDLEMCLEQIPDSLSPGLKVAFQQIQLNRVGKPND
ncbi:MAG: ATP-binding protein [bacterium]|nr:ATP-binding protein [bacterium]